VRKKFDLIVIGTGSAAATVAFKCRSAGWDVAIVDFRPFGGTCALRGCDPKKVLVGASELIDWVRRMHERGVYADDVRIEWPELMRFKRSFTVPLPGHQERRLAEVGIHVFHGRASFVGPTSVEVGTDILEGRYVVIATGAKPRKLDISGEQHVTESDRFLELEELPHRIVFIGGGYISFEFAHIAIRAGSEVTILHRGDLPLEQFDPDLVGQLVERTQHLGATVKMGAQVELIEKISDRLRVHASGRNGQTEAFEADLVVHGAGRVAEIDDLNLTTAGVQSEKRGVQVNEYLQSVSNPAVYAAGDAAATGLPALTPVAGYEGRIVASNLLKGNHRKFETLPIPTIVFTIPSLSAVGLSEQAARQMGLQFRVRHENTADWYSSRRIGQPCSGFKILIEEGTDRILGAHLIGPNADELINVFALAVRAGISSSNLKHTLFGYPTLASDLTFML
jgi:glutathione reductase (NADPH)